MNVMLNSAISFSVSVDDDAAKLPALIEKLGENYRVLYNENVELVTIRYYDQPTVDRVTAGKQIFLEVKSRYTVQIVMKNN
jgi:aspartate kinase